MSKIYKNLPWGIHTIHDMVGDPDNEIQDQINRFIPNSSGIATTVTTIEDPNFRNRHMLVVTISGHISNPDKNFEKSLLLGRTSTGAVSVNPV